MRELHPDTTTSAPGATLILTSHYMDDVAALCPRVIVIDKGVLSYDGALDELARRIRPEKRVVLQLDSPVDRATLEALGRVVSVDAASAVLQTPQESDLLGGHRGPGHAAGGRPDGGRARRWKR